MCVYCNRSQMTSQRVENKKVQHKTKSSGVTVVLYTLWRLLWSITVRTHMEKFNLLVLYNKNSNDLLKYFGGIEKDKFADVIWRGFDANSAHRSAHKKDYTWRCHAALKYFFIIRQSCMTIRGNQIMAVKRQILPVIHFKLNQIKIFAPSTSF